MSSVLARLLFKLGALFKLRVVVLVALFVMVAGMGVARAGVFNPKTFTLANGMQVVVLPNHRAPVVLQMVWYKVGAADEPKGKSGVAHLLEHLMFKGTKKNPGGSFSRIVARNGGQENAFTAYDYTGYYQVIAADRLAMVMALEADRMTNLVLSDKDVKMARAVVLEERNQRVENKPAARLSEEANRKLFPKGHPYGRLILGNLDELKALTRKDVLNFYKAHYAPNNAILVVAGDVSVGEVRRLAEKYYGVIAAAKIAPRKSLITSAAVRGGETVLRDPLVRQPSWSETIIAPSLTNGTPARVAALEVLSEILGGDNTSRLYRALVINQPKAVDVGTYYDPDARGPGRFVIYASPRPGETLNALIRAVRRNIRYFLKNGLRPGELARTKERMLATAVFARDQLKTGAWTIGAALAAGHTINDVEDWPDRIKAVKATDVLDALKAILKEPRRITSRLLPENKKSKAQKGNGS